MTFRSKLIIIPGDIITLGLCYSYSLIGSYFESIMFYDKKLTKDEVDQLKYKNQLKITAETFPDLNVFEILPPGYNDLELAITIIVTGEKDRSTSYFSLMPDMSPHLRIAAQTLDDNKHMRLIAADPEIFRQILYPGALNGIVFIPFDKDEPDGRQFPILEFVKDSENNIVGLITGSDGDFNFEIPFTGEDVGEASIIKDGVTLCTLDGVLLPLMEE